MAAHNRQQFSHVLNFIKTFGRGDRTASAFDRGSELDKHQTVKTKIAQSRIDRDFRARPVRNRGNNTDQPERIRIPGFLNTAPAA